MTDRESLDSLLGELREQATILRSLRLALHAMTAKVRSDDNAVTVHAAANGTVRLRYASA
ncbi:hypothetical protein GCM10009551_044980 [Nocardiopsis tropica]|uniref:hypothetical protein n=1 Tax=Tsukamurella strandjordii TaxID=147577 RepID=UPI0031E304C4